MELVPNLRSLLLCVPHEHNWKGLVDMRPLTWIADILRQPSLPRSLQTLTIVLIPQPDFVNPNIPYSMDEICTTIVDSGLDHIIDNLTYPSLKSIKILIDPQRYIGPSLRQRLQSHLHQHLPFMAAKGILSSYLCEEHTVHAQQSIAMPQSVDL